jgi:hypothetical protein
MIKVWSDFRARFTHLTLLNMSNPLSMSKVRLRWQHFPAPASLMVLTELYMYYRADLGNPENAEEL